MPLYFTFILCFIFGTIIGSFLNVLALRYNTGVTVRGRSKCMSCAKTLTWVELVPILSFMIQRGACRSCKAKISWQYPIVEFLSGALFVLLFMLYPPVSLVASIVTAMQIFILCILMVITIYDIKHKIIPDPLVWTFVAAAFLLMFVGNDTNPFVVPSVMQLLSGPILALPFALLWFVSHGEWMGLGDAKLILGIGWMLGLGYGLTALTMAFWIGAIFSLIYMAVSYKTFKHGLQIPFGPYLILGLYLVMVTGWQLFVI
ncbi:MAG: prepilin peptidase [Patescibacteria group bacterium]|nr:prepilin peptidase [Patescibacteria group bacterium]